MYVCMYVCMYDAVMDVLLVYMHRVTGSKWFALWAYKKRP